MPAEKFEAPDIRTALTAVKAALGADAVIMGTRQLPPRGLFRRTWVEVTAMRPEPAVCVPARVAQRRYQSMHLELADEPPAPPMPTLARQEAAPRAMHDELAPLRSELQAMRAELEAQREPAPAGPATELTDDPMLARLGKQVAEELTTLRRMLAAVSLGGKALGQVAQDANRAILEAADVDPEVADALMADLTVEGASDPAYATTAKLERAIAQAIPTEGEFFAQRGHRRVALVGPTGVGKTTTVAKIAAHAALKHQMKVALISLDTYRIGATEQISHYARLLNIPMITAHDRQSFVAALDKFADADLVLIDTAGRAPNQAGAHCLQLRQMFQGYGVEVFLTLAAATRRYERQDMLTAMGDLERLGARALILTKLDEAVALGSCLSLTHRTGLPLAFVTAGQRVPEDLTVAEAPALAARLIERVLLSRDRALSGSDAPIMPQSSLFAAPTSAYVEAAS